MDGFGGGTRGREGWIILGFAERRLQLREEDGGRERGESIGYFKNIFSMYKGGGGPTSFLRGKTPVRADARVWG
jgi:hypothetical protein